MIATATRSLIALALVVTAAAALAAEYSDLYIIPIAGHARGAHGTSWRSDVVLHNIQAVPVSVELALVESGRVPSAAPLSLDTPGEPAFVLMPGETRTLADVAARLGRDVTGALIVGADLPFAVTSRTWAELPNGTRTLGQSVLPIALAGTPDALNEVAVLPSLAHGARQRSNVGLFIAASRAPLVIELALLTPAGTAVDTQRITVSEPGFLHRQFAIRGSDSTPTTTAVIRIVEGDGIVVPYGSTIDNTSAEAIFLSAAPILVHPTPTRTLLAATVTATR